MKAIELIAAERQRQVAVEGWNESHDDGHKYDELAKAATCYAMPSYQRWVIGLGHTPGFPLHTPQTIHLWPWANDWWKPTPQDRIKELVKAGALIAAEIERLQREQETEPLNSPPLVDQPIYTQAIDPEFYM